MRRDRDDEVTIEDAKIVWRNFEGKEGKYNRKGDRNFSIILPEPLGQQLEGEGWNIKRTNVRPDVDGDVAEPYITISVGFRFPPRLYLISSRGRTELDEESCDILDLVDIEWADVKIRPYNWDVNGNQGIKAYLKTLYVKVYEDELDLKYSDVPDALPTSSGRVRD